MATPAQIGFFGSARVTRIMQGLTDPRLLSPQQLIWNQRVPDVPAIDEEVIAKYIGTPLIADMIADDAKGLTYSQGRFQFQSYQVPNIKMGLAMNQAQMNALRRIQEMGGVPNDEVNYFTDRQLQNIKDVKYGVELRKETLKLAMLLDGLDYDRLGFKMSNVTWGMYSDLKVTVSPVWTGATGLPITDINAVRYIAKARYGIDLNRATMSTPTLRAAVATTEWANQVKLVYFPTLLGGPTPAALLQNDSTLKTYFEKIVAGTGEPFYIETDDRRYWSQDAAGAITSNRFFPIGKVLLTSTANDGNGQAYDFANCTVSESIITGMSPSSVIGGAVVAGRGPIGYTTLADPQLNPPGYVTWGVARGFPRKHLNASSAVLTIGTPTETVDTAVPTVV